MASRFDRIGLCPYLHAHCAGWTARAVFRDPRFEPTLKASNLSVPRSATHVVAAVGQQEGAILSHFSKSEDANDQAP